MSLTPTQRAPPIKKMIRRLTMVLKARGIVRRGSLASPAITVMTNISHDKYGGMVELTRNVLWPGNAEAGDVDSVDKRD